ncbi:MAG: DUF177 domain-containing protein [Bauldia sp.]
MSQAPLLSRPLHLSEVGEGGIVVSVEANAAERTALATALGLPEVKSLTAEVRLTAKGRTGVLAEGHVHAEIEQTCVVSLVPVDQTIDEDFSVRFAQGGEAVARAKPGIEIELDSGDLDQPEVLTGPTLDLGALVTEQFVLAIDPYPRAPGAELSPEATDPEDQSADSPFAALAGLGRDSGNPR